MALGKNFRGEGRKSSNYCSTGSVAVIVAFCLVGIWIVMSSIVPFQNSVMQVHETINEGKHIVSKNGSRQFEDSFGDIPEESTRADSQTQTQKSESESHPENEGDQKGVENVSDDAAEENKQEVVRDSSGQSSEKNDSEKDPENTIEESYQMSHVNPSTGKKESDRNLNSELVEAETIGGQINDDELRGPGETLDESNKSINNKLGTEKSTGEATQQDEMVVETEEEKIEKNVHSETKQSTGESNMESHENSQASKEVFTAGNQSETLIEASTENGTSSTQAAESQREKESQKSLISVDSSKYDWKLCKTTAGSEYIPCLDNWKAIRMLRSIRHYEHRERHCPDEASTCLVPLPEGYRSPLRWPQSREKVCNTNWRKSHMLLPNNESQ